jgi:hypothetical protein
MGDNVRPNILESDMEGGHLAVPANITPFALGVDGDIMLTEDFKVPIDTHNH